MTHLPNSAGLPTPEPSQKYRKARYSVPKGYLCQPRAGVGSVHASHLTHPSRRPPRVRTRPGPGASRRLGRAADVLEVVRGDGLPGQDGADAAELGGGAAESELEALGCDEVAVQRVVGVDAHPAVDVHGGVGDPVARVG